MAATRFWLLRLAACFKSPDVMVKPADMQCKALLGGADKKTATPDRCPYQKTEIKGPSGFWSVYCKGHRQERNRMMAAGEQDANGDRLAPVAIRKEQTQREAWIDAGTWKRGDPI